MGQDQKWKTRQAYHLDFLSSFKCQWRDATYRMQWASLGPPLTAITAWLGLGMGARKAWMFPNANPDAILYIPFKLSCCIWTGSGVARFWQRASVHWKSIRFPWELGFKPRENLVVRHHTAHVEIFQLELQIRGPATLRVRSLRTAQRVPDDTIPVWIQHQDTGESSITVGLNQNDVRGGLKSTKWYPSRSRSSQSSRLASCLVFFVCFESKWTFDVICF